MRRMSGAAHSPPGDATRRSSGSRCSALRGRGDGSLLLAPCSEAHHQDRDDRRPFQGVPQGQEAPPWRAHPGRPVSCCACHGSSRCGPRGHPEFAKEPRELRIIGLAKEHERHIGRTTGLGYRESTWPPRRAFASKTVTSNSSRNRYAAVIPETPEPTTATLFFARNCSSRWCTTMCQILGSCRTDRHPRCQCKRSS